MYLSIPSQLFFQMPQCMYACVCYNHLYKGSAPSCYSSTATFNNCYSKLAAYTVLPYSYWVSFYNVDYC